MEDLVEFPWAGPSSAGQVSRCASHGRRPFAVFDADRSRLHPRALVGSFSAAKQVVLGGTRVERRDPQSDCARVGRGCSGQASRTRRPGSASTMASSRSAAARLRRPRKPSWPSPVPSRARYRNSAHRSGANPGVVDRLSRDFRHDHPRHFGIKPTHPVAANDKVARIEDMGLDEIQHRAVDHRPLDLH